VSGARDPGAAAYRAVLEALAVGDALGMPTEFMTRRAIAARFAAGGGLVDGLADPALFQNHPNLRRAQVTDDTEQNVYLIKEYVGSRRVDPDGTARALLRWARETGAEEKRYIGPSSLKALKAIEAGQDVAKTGFGGTTCGAVMRAPAAALCAAAGGWDLREAVIASCLPTHNTSQALEAAMAYACALRAALQGAAMPDVLAAAAAGAAEGLAAAPYEACAASTADRVAHLGKVVPGCGSPAELLDFLYGVLGTGLESGDVAAAAFGIFLYAEDDVWLAVRMGASTGGDTDTIAALAGALCAAFAGGHDIPRAVVDEVVRSNGLDLEGLAVSLAGLRG
jgi:ADP-ribosylglycohydrolase